ncbi:AAA family ATPase [Alteromonas antoniana]|uniref:AAA family ATPase n=1 Tax=Alteromonas antoniana TaxID=2803813 RepID=UPI001C48B45E|nr:AAA family ATPase [Alteromonas antoniana]
MGLSDLFSRQDGLIERKVQYVEQKASYQSYIDAKDEIDAILNSMAEAAQVGAVRLYSELLTTLVNDVMGANQTVILDTRKIRGKVHLDLYIEEDGNKVDISEGKGGSVCNLIAVGMRIISVIQSSSRRFIFLDEPDCWLEPRLVGRFVNVLHRLSTDVGVQIVYISHHTSDVIGENVYNVHLSKRHQLQVTEYGNVTNQAGGALSADLLESNGHFGVEWLNGAGIKSIRIQNFMSHQDTTINLSPGVTLLTGSNDIGKSVVLRALSALAYNVGRDGYVRHQCDSCRVEVRLEDDVVIGWGFSTKKNVKSVYSLRIAGESKEFEVKPGEVPEAISETLGIASPDKFDLHFAEQRDSLFLLNPAIKGHERANFLQLSDDFEVVTKMMAEHQKKLTDCRARVRYLGEELAETTEQLSILQPIAQLHSLEECISTTDISNFSSDLEKTVNWLSSKSKLQSVADTVFSLRSLDSAVSEVQNVSVKGYRALRVLESDRAISLQPLIELDHTTSSAVKRGKVLAQLIDVLESQDMTFDLQTIASLQAVALPCAQQNVGDELGSLIKTLGSEENFCPQCGQAVSQQELHS